MLPFSLPLLSHTGHYLSKVPQLWEQHKRLLNVARENHSAHV